MTGPSGQNIFVFSISVWHALQSNHKLHSLLTYLYNFREKGKQIQQNTYFKLNYIRKADVLDRNIRENNKDWTTVTVYSVYTDI